MASSSGIALDEVSNEWTVTQFKNESMAILTRCQKVFRKKNLISGSLMSSATKSAVKCYVLKAIVKLINDAGITQKHRTRQGERYCELPHGFFENPVGWVSGRQCRLQGWPTNLPSRPLHTWSPTHIYSLAYLLIQSRLLIIPWTRCHKQDTIDHFFKSTTRQIDEKCSAITRLVKMGHNDVELIHREPSANECADEEANHSEWENSEAFEEFYGIQEDKIESSSLMDETHSPLMCDLAISDHSSSSEPESDMELDYESAITPHDYSRSSEPLSCMHGSGGPEHARRHSDFQATTIKSPSILLPNIWEMRTSPKMAAMHPSLRAQFENAHSTMAMILRLEANEANDVAFSDPEFSEDESFLVKFQLHERRFVNTNPHMWVKHISRDDLLLTCLGHGDDVVKCQAW